MQKDSSDVVNDMYTTVVMKRSKRVESRRERSYASLGKTEDRLKSHLTVIHQARVIALAAKNAASKIKNLL